MSADMLGLRDRQGNLVVGERWEVAHRAMIEAANKVAHNAIMNGRFSREGPKQEVLAAVHAALEEHDDKVAAQEAPKNG